ncbi:MAG: phosphatase PAP2 family protein [candidate division SR1 bacterium]|nr:phosphatase PAP2 family protein [candidate division SR1 bacterium]
MKVFSKKFVQSALIGFFLLFLIYLTREVLERETSNVDTTVYNFMISFRSSHLTFIMIAISFIGEQIAVLMAVLLILFYILKRKFMDGLLTFLAIFLASTVTYFLKIITARSRPDMMFRLATENNFSFPSGHATIAFTVYPILLIMFWRSMQSKGKSMSVLTYILVGILTLIPILVGISRLYLGVHFFSDVLAGTIIGLFFSYLFAITSKHSIYSKTN